MVENTLYSTPEQFEALARAGEIVQPASERQVSAVSSLFSRIGGALLNVTEAILLPRGLRDYDREPYQPLTQEDYERTSRILDRQVKFQELGRGEITRAELIEWLESTGYDTGVFNTPRA